MTGANARSFKAYAVVEALLNGSADIREALAPFFQPLLAFNNEKIFDPSLIASSANDSYSWSITADIVEGFIPTFVSAGWLTTIDTNDQSGAYRVSCYLPDGTFHSNLPEDLKSLGSAFHEFVVGISPISAASRKSDDLLNSLLRWIVSLEAYSDDDLHKEITKTAESNSRSIYNVVTVNSGVSQDDQFLCARFCQSVVNSDTSLAKTIADVARIGLLTEAVNDFARPITAIKKTNVAIYLDTPVAMDLLDISGAAARDNIRPIIERLQRMGASIRIFDTSLSEIQRNLAALLRRPEPQRTGVTATAIRRGQVLESYVRYVASNPKQALDRLSVQTVARNLDQFPNDHRFFSQHDYEVLYSNVNWHTEDVPRAHDAEIVTNIMRMRRGSYSSDIFESAHTF